MRYPNYEDTPEGFIGKCYMTGAQAIDVNKYKVEIIPKSFEDKKETRHLVEISKL